MKNKKRIALIGGGPSGLFMFKRLVDTGNTGLIIDIFEKKRQLGSGMPYSVEGAGDEHVTNVSGNEIPEIVTSIADWIKTVHKDTLDKFHIDPNKFNDYKVLPRLLFGQYLAAQFDLLKKQAKDAGMDFTIRYNTTVTDIIDYPQQGFLRVEVDGDEQFEYDQVIICTGHNWPKKHEGKIQGYFDSPYPPGKLGFEVNHPVAIRGASLTAVDALRTLSRHNGTYAKDENGKLTYKLKPGSKDFKLVMHTRNGLLPAVRFHLEDTHLTNDAMLTKDEIDAHIAGNGGFLSLDFVFENDFKILLKDKQPDFFEHIKDMTMEQFVEDMMARREQKDPFELLKEEYDEAERSIKQEQSVYWKEALGALSFAMNYPAKHLSAEDMQRLQKTLSPLISVVIAYIPQSSCEEMFALHDAGVLEMVIVGNDSEVEAAEKGGINYIYTDESGEKQSVFYRTYVDCVGQPHLDYEDFPFRSMVDKQVITPGKLQFKDAEHGAAEINKGNEKVETDGKGSFYLNVPGIAINDNFQVVDAYGALNERIFIMAVPYIGGYNPDYSGLDFCEEASERIADTLLFKDEHRTTTATL